MRAIWRGRVLAEGDDVVMVEGNRYFAPEAVRTQHLRLTRRPYLCPRKGLARYYDVVVDGTAARRAAWSYRRPFPWYRRIRGRIAFSADLVEPRDDVPGVAGERGRVEDRVKVQA